MCTTRTLLLSLALWVFAASASAGSSVYVGNGAQFGTVDLTTGSFQTIGPGTPDGVTGLASGPNGSLLTLSLAGKLESINPSTGAVTIVGPTGLADCSTLTSLCGPTSANTIAEFGGKIYATDFQNKLYAVSPLTGTAKAIGLTGMPVLPFIPLTTNPDGSLNIYDEALFGAGNKMYATFDTGTINPGSGVVTTTMPAHLYQIDPSTGRATVVGPTGFSIGAAVDLGGTVYGFENATHRIVTLDLASGGTSVVGNFDPSAGILVGAAATPEPSSIALAGLGIAAFAVYKRHARQ